MTSIAFVVAYFVWGGVLPNYFTIWARTCGFNPTVDFLFFTDADVSNIDLPNNIRVYSISWREIQKRVQGLFPFKISIERPYKLCDYKPAYGELFAEYLKDYDFWGYCDIDLFWGNIRRFVTDEILEQYDRIYTRGHCSLMRNNKEVNSWYRTLPNHGYLDYKEVYQSPKSFCFDEWAGHCGGGLSYIMMANGINSYDEPDMADIDYKTSDFRINRMPEYNNKKSSFKVSIDGCFVCNPVIEKKEVIYCHFQKRRLQLKENLNLNKSFYLIAPNLVSNENEPCNVFKHINYNANFILSAIKRRIK